MQETRVKPENAIFFTAQSPVAMSNPDFIYHMADIKEAFSKKTHDTTVCSQAILSKLKVSIVEQMPEMPDDSYLEEFQDFIRKMPLQMSNDISHFTDMSFFNIGKHEMTPSVLLEKQKMLLHSNWLNQLELACIIDYNNKKQKTVCRIRDAELQFQSGTSFRLTKITKLKVMFHQFQKCIRLTYDEMQGKKTTEIRFKIFLENDTKDDLYVFMAKIIVEKLMLMDYEVDLDEGEDPDCDKFIMKGNLFKKGQVLDQWNQRFMVLNDRIESYKEGQFTFEMKNVKEIWTRFDVKDGKLVLKLRHGQKKTELAIPIVNYPVRFCKDNWLYRIYRLLSV